MDRVMLIKADFKDKSEQKATDFLNIIKEKGELVHKNLSGFDNITGQVYTHIEFRPFDPKFPEELISAVSKKVSNKTITIKSRYGNIFKFKIID